MKTSLSKFYPLSYLKNRRNNQDFDIYEFKNGIYQGDFVDFKREGYGIYFWNDGQIYLGQWKEDQMEGIGIVLFGFGGYIYGKFSRNKLNGPGILTFPNGNIHACSNWKAGKLSEKYIKYNHEDKTWKYSRYLYTVQLEETNEKNNIHKEFSQIKEDILQKSEIPFEYKEYFFTFPFTKFYKDKIKGMAHPKRCIDFLTSNYDSWYFGITTDGVPDGLGILGLNNEIRLRGVFQNGKLNGIGRSQSEKGDIHDGIFIDGELNIGFVFLKNQERYIYANYQNGKVINKLKEGRGFPYDLLSACKQNIYQINLSYYYKYTAIEIIYLNDHDRKLMNIYPLIRNSQHRNNTPNEKKILSAQKKEKTIQRQLSSKFSQTPAKNNIKNSIESFDNQTDIIDESNEKFTPKETHQENSFHRKSISLERSKYSELNFESPSKDRIKKCTFNDDTPKKVSFPKENDLTKTQKSKSNYENVFDQKKPTSNEYSAFISSPDYYKEKVGEIMNSFHDNEEIQFDEEDPVGKVNILDLKKSVEDPPSFASFGNIPEQEIPHKNEILIQNCKLEGNNKKEYQKSKSIGEKSNDNLQKDRDKNAIIIYYDNEKGLSDDIKIDLNQFDCKFYNLCTNQIEKPVLQVHNKFKLGK